MTTNPQTALDTASAALTTARNELLGAAELGWDDMLPTAAAAFRTALDAYIAAEARYQATREA